MILLFVYLVGSFHSISFLFDFSYFALLCFELCCEIVLSISYYDFTNKE